MKSPRDRFVEMKRSGHRFATLTVYDYVFARLLDDLGLDFLLVGDSLGMVQLGHPDTTGVTMEQMEHHVAAAAAGIKQSLLIADLPAGSFEDKKSTLDHARRLLRAGACGVKIEGGAEFAFQVAAMVADGIPVLGHIGMLPQKVREEGGYKIKGRTEEEAASLLADALALQDAGAFAIVLELVEESVARRITGAIEIPSIGIGSGEFCDGQILVSHDLLGLFPWFRPAFVRPKADLAGEIRLAVGAYRDEIRNPARPFSAP